MFVCVQLDTIELKDITANGLRAVLDFIYTGELSLSIENIGKFVWRGIPRNVYEREHFQGFERGKKSFRWAPLETSWYFLITIIDDWWTLISHLSIT